MTGNNACGYRSYAHTCIACKHCKKLHYRPLSVGLSTRKCVAWNLPWPRFSPQAFRVLVVALVVMMVVVCSDSDEHPFFRASPHIWHFTFLISQSPDVDRTKILIVNGEGALGFDNRTPDSAATSLRPEIFLGDWCFVTSTHLETGKYDRGSSSFITVAEIVILFKLFKNLVTGGGGGLAPRARAKGLSPPLFGLSECTFVS